MKYASVRDIAESMRPIDAVDYLLQALEDGFAAMARNAPHPVDAWRAGLTPAQRRIAICLYDARGDVRTHRQVYAACCFGATGQPQPEIVKSHISRLRRKIAGRAEILSISGVGYQMELKE